MTTPYELLMLSEKATKRLNHLELTGITDRKSLLLAILKDLPPGLDLLDASVGGINNLLVREKINGTTD